MSIAMVSLHANPLVALGQVDTGDQHLHVAELSAALARQGYEVTVYTRREDNEQPPQVWARDGYRVVHVPAGPPRRMRCDDLLPHVGRFGWFLQREWRNTRPDIVHAHFWLSGLASVLAARSSGMPVVQTFHALGAVQRRHDGDAGIASPERLLMERVIGKNVSRVVSTSSDEMVELTRLGVPKARISVVPRGVDLDRFIPDGPCAKRGELYRIVAAGRLVPSAGFATAIAALRGIPHTELVIAAAPEHGIVSDDGESRRLRSLAERCGVRNRVRMLGRVARRDMPGLLRSADVVVCIPWHEPLDTVPLEAMACGVPVVAAAVGMLGESVIAGVTGELIPPRQPRVLAATVRKLLADPATREAYGVAGIDRARSRYSWDRVATDTLRAYQRALPELAPA